jgi:para-aminobenzoate synthetase/4-amino-4-deoxychorismate lyase
MLGLRGNSSNLALEPAELLSVLGQEGSLFLDSSILEGGAKEGRPRGEKMDGEEMADPARRPAITLDQKGWSKRGGLLFSRPKRILAVDHPDGLRSLFATLEDALSEGLYVAGWLSYEAGYLMDEGLSGLLRKALLDGACYRQPLAWFGIYDAPLVLDPASLTGPLGTGAQGPPPDILLAFAISRADFCRNIERIHEYIRAGDTYQVNYTIQGRFRAEVPARQLYFALRGRQRVGYGAFINCGRGLRILSFSPELFFIKAGGKLCSRPMKGTLPRAADPNEDERRLDMLSKDAKNRAENVMIVDLIRNDLGRIARTGSVRVPELFRVERYETLIQMISVIEAELSGRLSWQEIFEALFPCGSITGAPKIRTMEIIQELEQGPRGVYTGAIGYICPSGDGVFNVAIRTIEMHGDEGRLGVGAGITIGSEPEKELEETVLKARFLTERVSFR